MMVITDDGSVAAVKRVVQLASCNSREQPCLESCSGTARRTDYRDTIELLSELP